METELVNSLVRVGEALGLAFAWGVLIVALWIKGVKPLIDHYLTYRETVTKQRSDEVQAARQHNEVMQSSTATLVLAHSQLRELLETSIERNRLMSERLEQHDQRAAKIGEGVDQTAQRVTTIGEKIDALSKQISETIANLAKDQREKFDAVLQELANLKAEIVGQRVPDPTEPETGDPKETVK